MTLLKNPVVNVSIKKVKVGAYRSLALSIATLAATYKTLSNKVEILTFPLTSIVAGISPAALGGKQS
jgi:hypothetical protein